MVALAWGLKPEKLPCGFVEGGPAEGGAANANADRNHGIDIEISEERILLETYPIPTFKAA